MLVVLVLLLILLALCSLVSSVMDSHNACPPDVWVRILAALQGEHLSNYVTYVLISMKTSFTKSTNAICA